MNIKRTLLLLAAATLVAIGLVTCKTQTPQESVDKALATLVQDNQTLNNININIRKESYPVTITAGTLPEGVLGRTLVTETGAQVTVDTHQVIQRRDRLEPVIGHELIHIHDARFKFGMPQFIEIVSKERDLPWDQRTVEKSAIEQENQLRKELIATGRYKGMPETRQLQNQRPR